jgi:dolichol-phosphate mannosyltransferase
MTDDLISIIIPTYNERDNITPLVERLSKTLAGRKFEILFIDDNSKDGTIDVIADLATKYPVKGIFRASERGLATAVLHGFKFVQGNIIGVMDADLQHPPEVNGALIKAIENGADLAIASRYVPGGGVPNWGLLRRVISKGASSIAHLFLPDSRKVRDPMSGFFVFRGEGIDQVVFKPIGYKILLELLIIGKFNNVVEVPFIFEDRSSGRSKMKAKQQIDYLKHILSLMRRKGELTRLFKFLAVGLCGTIVNLGILRLITLFTTWNQLVQLIPGIEISIITNFLLNDYFTFADRRTGKTRSFIFRLLKYNLVSLTSAFINWGIASILVTIGLNIIVADFIGILISFFFNYLFSMFWTWK